MWLTLTLIVLVLTLFYQYYRNVYGYWQRLGVPHETPLPIIGNMAGIGTRYHFRDINARIYKRFKGQAPYAGMFMFLKRTAMLLDLELIKQILIKDFANFSDRGLYHNVEDDPLTGHLLTLEGEQWRAMRQKLTPVFTSGKMKFMFPTIVKVGTNLASALDAALTQNGDNNGEQLELKDLCARFTTDVIGTCAFGLECNSLHNPNAEFRARGRDIFQRPRHSQFVQAFMLTNPTWARRLHLKLFRDDISAFFMEAVRTTVDYRIKNGIKRNDFLDMMIELRAADEQLAKESGGIDLTNGLTMEQIAAQAFVFYVAGFETSSSTMAFCLHNLACNEAVQQKLRAEIMTVLAKHNNILSYEAMQDMKYLDQVLAETLRLYPIIANLLRQTLADYKVPDTNLIIKKGTTIMIPVDAIHHDAAYYPEPERFDPSRFDAAAVETRHSCAYLPFGDGPRNCIGLRFGKMQAKIGLISLLQKYKFGVSKLTEIPLELDKRNFPLSPKNGIHLKIERI